MSNRTSPSTSADLAQGNVSKKPAGAEAPASVPSTGLLKAGQTNSISPRGPSIASGNSSKTTSANNSLAGGNLSTKSLNNNKEKDKGKRVATNIGISEGSTDHTGRASSLSIGSNDSRRMTSDTQDDSGVFATNSQHEAVDESISYLNMQTVQVSPVLSSITDTSSSTRGERHHSTSSSYKTQSKTSPYIAPINPAGLTTGRDRSTSFDKHRNPMNNNQGGRDRNNLGDRNRHGRGDPNIIHQQYHNPQLQSQQQNYYNMNRQRSGNQQGVGGGMNNNPQLQSQQPNMQQQYFEIPQYMHGNMIYGNVLPQQPQQLMQQHNLAHQLAQHQQFVDPRISQYMAGMSIAAPGHTAFYLNQNNRGVIYPYAQNGVGIPTPQYPYGMPQEHIVGPHMHSYPQHSMDQSMSMMGPVYMPGQYPQQFISTQQVPYNNQPIGYGNPSRISMQNQQMQGMQTIGQYNNPVGQQHQQQQQQQPLSPHTNFIPGSIPVADSVNGSVSTFPSQTANQSNISAHPSNSVNSSTSEIPTSNNSSAFELPPPNGANNTLAAVQNVEQIQPPQPSQLSSQQEKEKDVEDAKVAKPRAYTYKSKSGEVLDIGVFRKEAPAVTMESVASEEPDSGDQPPSTDPSRSIEVTVRPDAVTDTIEDGDVASSVPALVNGASSVVNEDIKFVDSSFQPKPVESHQNVSASQEISGKGLSDLDIAASPTTSSLPVSTSNGNDPTLSSASTSNANSRNTSPRGSSLKSEDVSDWRSGGSGKMLPPPAVAVNPVNNTRSKKSKKDLYAAADAKSASGSIDILSAYKDDPIPPPAVEPAPLKPSTSEVKEVVPPPVDETELPDSWDETFVPTLNLTAVATKDDSVSNSVPLALATVVDGDDSALKIVVKDAPSRSLRPGGVLGGPKVIKLNKGQSTNVYSKEELLTLKASSVSSAPSSLLYAGPITAIPWDQQIGSNSSGGQYGKGQYAQGSEHTRTQNQPQPQGGWGKYPNQNQHRESSHSGKETQEGGGWERKIPQQAPQTTAAQSSYQSSQGTPQPMPKSKLPLTKKISDPMELLSIEVKSILNKITPQTFEKLSLQMLSLDVRNTAMLDRVIDIIFDKALDEPYFTQLYAELCSYFNKEGTQWVFYTIVNYLEDSSYFWIKDFAFEPVVAGPFNSKNECFASVLDVEVKPPLKPPSFNLNSDEVVLIKDTLFKIYTDEAEQYYVTYVPFSDVPEDKRCNTIFVDLDKVKKDARNNNNFRSRLVNKCQAEFEKTAKNESIYGDLEKAKQQLLLQKGTLSSSEYALQEADIAEKQFKIKRRMLGNIRFVGELYKKGLISTKVMDSCIAVLLGTRDAWKDIKDDQDIELLCKLLTTIGQTFEEKSNSEQSQHFEAYFERMLKLSKDKSLNSRMRFSIEEVIFLRNNNWQARREQEGPLKISEIHQKIQEEEERNKISNKQQQQQQQAGFGYPSQGMGNRQQMHPQQQQGFYRGGNPAMHHGRGSPQYDGKLSRTASVGPGAGYEMSPQQGEHMRRTNSESLGSNQRRLSNYDNRPPPGGYHQQGPPNQMMQGQGLGPMHAQQQQYVSPGPQHYQQQPHQQPPHQQQQQRISFTDELTLRRARGLIAEYLKNGDLSEIRASFQEARTNTFGGYFVIEVINKAVDSNQSAVSNQLMRMLRDEQVAAYLNNCKGEVEAALRSMEAIKMLADTVVDSSHAPEIIGQILRSLVDLNVINFSKVYSMIGEFKELSIKEEIFSADEVSNIFGRCLNSLNSVH